MVPGSERVAWLAAVAGLALLSPPVAYPQDEGDIPANFPVAAVTRWEAPTRKITNLEEFFSTIPETEIQPGSMRRMAFGVVAAVAPENGDRTVASFRLEVDPEAPPLPTRREVSLSLPLRDMGQPFAAGQSWTLYFDGAGRIVHLQTEGTLTHYRRRADGFVQIRLQDAGGRVVEVLPTTLMPPEGAVEGGFFSYLGLFREAGLVAGYDAVGGPSSLELESISLPALEARRDGLLPDPAPWNAIGDGGIGGAIPAGQRFAY